MKNVRILFYLKTVVMQSLYLFHSLIPHRMSIVGYSKLQITGGIDDNSKIIFLFSQQKHML